MASEGEEGKIVAPSAACRKGEGDVRHTVRYRHHDTRVPAGGYDVQLRFECSRCAPAP